MADGQLFDADLGPLSDSPKSTQRRRGGKPRLVRANRRQLRMEARSLEELLPDDHRGEATGEVSAGGLAGARRDGPAPADRARAVRDRRTLRACAFFKGTSSRAARSAARQATEPVKLDLVTGFHERVGCVNYACVSSRAGRLGAFPGGASDSAGFHPHSSRVSLGDRCTLRSVRSGAAISETASRANLSAQSPGSGGESSAVGNGVQASVLTGRVRFGGRRGRRSDGCLLGKPVRVVERVVDESAPPESMKEHREFPRDRGDRFPLGGSPPARH